MKYNKSKIFFREITFLTVLNFFPVQKLIFGYFWNCKKMDFGQKNFKMKLIYWFQDFFGLDFFKFSGLLWYCLSVSALIHFRLIAVGKLDKIDDFSPDVAVREWNQIKLHINKPRNRRAMGPSTSSRNKLQFTVYWKKAVGSKVHTKVSIIYIQS